MAKLCGAKGKTSGLPCKRPPVRGKTRCKLHGGMSTGPNSGKRTLNSLGIYSNAIAPGEGEIWHDIPIDGIGDEIKVARLRVRRLFAAVTKAEEDEMSALRVHEVRTDKIGDKQTSSITKRRADLETELDRAIGRVARLVRQHSETEGADRGGSAETKARELRDLIQQMEDATIAKP